MHQEAQTSQSEPLNFQSQAELLNCAKNLYDKKMYPELHNIFSKYLKKSYDINLWELYMEYVYKISTKKVSTCEVYAYVLNHFEFSYFIIPLVKKYISELQNQDEDALNVEKIRKVYHRTLENPGHGLDQLWGEYEKWEFALNRLTAKGYIEQIHPLYQNASTVYHRLFSHIENDDFFGILDIELENLLKLNKKSFEKRFHLIFNFYISKFPASEPLLILRSFYLKDHVKIESPETTLLSIWYSYLYNTSYFNFNDHANLDLVMINSFNWTLKNKGVDAFRTRFSEVKDTVGPYVYVYASRVEYDQGDKKTAYQICNEAVDRFPKNPLVLDEFFKLFADDENIHSLFQRLSKTEKIWTKMVSYEFSHGDADSYREMLRLRDVAIEKNEILKSVNCEKRASFIKGTKGVYESIVENLGFMDLRIVNRDVCKEFLSQLPELPRSDNILSSFDNKKIVSILAKI